MLSRNWIFVGFVEEIGIYRLGLVVDFSNQP
jgi:hypothetical protein